MKDVLTGKKPMNARFCINMAFILFFSYRGWYGLFRLSRFQITDIGSVAIIYILVIAAAGLSEKNNRELLAGCIFLGIIASIFAITWCFHPEYGSWYFDNPDYNLLSSVFYPTGGIFAFIFIFMMDDVEDMRKNMKWVGWIMFLFAIYTLIPVILHGHWSSTGAAAGDPSAANESNYSLSFGYRTVISLLIFWTEYRRSRDKRYLVLSIICFVMIVLFGGRGTLLSIMLFFGIRYLGAGKPRSLRAWLFVFLAAVLAVLLYTGILFRLLTAFIGLLGSAGSSRSLQMLTDGTFFQDGARQRIWNLAIRMIQNGGIFGYGPYGDRMVIGRYYTWGYSHDVFLELMVDFGLFGLLFIILLLAGIVWFLSTMDTRWKDMFIIFLGLSCQLLVSDSFWYNSYFWAVLAFLLKHRKYLLSRTAVYAVSNPIFYKLIKKRQQSAC